MKRWRRIKNHPNYKISSFGDVKNIKTNRILTPSLDKRGYYKVSLNGKTEKVHRLVGIAFIPNIEGMPIVDHINNKERLNNHVSNLRWNSYSGNGFNTGLPKNNTSGHKSISWDKKYEKWRVTITINGKQKNKGCFENIEDAIKKRDEVNDYLKRETIF